MLHRLKIVFSIDLRSLALFRVCLGSLIVLDLLLRSRDIAAFYTDQGVLPRVLWLQTTSPSHWSLHTIGGHYWFQVALFLIAGLAALLLIVGYKTRVMTFICWVLTVSLVNRNEYIINSGDELLVLLTFWAMFLPLHARYSIDSALRLENQVAPNNVSSKNLKSNVSTNQQFFSVATVAILLQVLYLYFFAAVLKTGDAWVINMDAAWYALSLLHYATPLGKVAVNYPDFLMWATHFVIAIEYSALFLALSPWFHVPLRLATLTCLFALHFSFLLLLHLGLFPLVDFAALTLLIPGAVWATLSTRDHSAVEIKERSPVTLYYDDECGFCKKTCLILRELLLDKRSLVLPAQQFPDIHALMLESNSWVVTDGKGHTHTRWEAMQVVFSQRFFAQPIGWLMGFKPAMVLGGHAYEFVAKNREQFSTISERFLPYKKISIEPSLVGQLLAAVFLCVVTVANVSKVKEWRIPIPEYAKTIELLVRADQDWDMFAPYPLTYSLYPVVTGELRNGTKVNLLTGDREKPSAEIPEDMYEIYGGYRWRKYLGQVFSSASNTILTGYGSHFCDAWNITGKKHTEELATLTVKFFQIYTTRNAVKEQPIQHEIWRHWCFDEFEPRN